MEQDRLAAWIEALRRKVKRPYKEQDRIVTNILVNAAGGIIAGMVVMLLTYMLFGRLAG